MAFSAFVSWPAAPLTDRLVRKSLENLRVAPSAIHTALAISDLSNLLQWSTYDEMDHELTQTRTENVLMSSYTIRKSLIRKHFLSRCIHSYITKHPESLLKSGVPRTWELELSFADELEEMWTDELWELGEELEDPSKWFILKPGMADRGMGIRLFNSKHALQAIFEAFEQDSDEEEDETAVVTSQLRHFVIQEYIPNPLLLDPSQTISPNAKALQGHKFHVRVYCVAVGALQLYLSPNMLALFSSVPYSQPITSNGDTATAINLAAHLTNSSLQMERGEEGVRLLSELAGCQILPAPHLQKEEETGEALALSDGHLAGIIDQISIILAEAFNAALGNPIHFQPLPNAFELYGVDFLVTQPPVLKDRMPFQVKLLEINAEPAIELTGPRLTWILEDLFSSIGKVCVEPFFAKMSEGSSATAQAWPIGEIRHGLRKCLDVNVRGPGAW